jgi:hypothetical protein
MHRFFLVWLVLGLGLAQDKSPPSAMRTYGPMDVVTPHGWVTLSNISIFKPSIIGVLEPRLRANSDNPTPGAWTKARFRVKFRCPGSGADTTYDAVVLGMSTGKDTIEGVVSSVGSGIKVCDPESITINYLDGESDHERRAILAKASTLDSGTPAAFFGADQKCAQQFLEALSLGGVEMRKKLADLILFKCGYIDESPLKVEKTRADGAYCLVVPVEGQHKGEPGWVPCAWVR